MKKRLILILIPLLFYGCAGGWMVKLEKNLPEGGFDTFSMKEDFGPAVSISIQASGAIREENILKVDEALYDRTGNFTSSHIYIKGLILELPIKEE